MPLSMEKTEKIVVDFLSEYNGNIPLDMMIHNKQEDLYGPQASRERCGFKIEGGYHPGRGGFAIIASNLDDEKAARRLIRHEILGHYGLNTFKPEEKRAFLTQILDTKKEPTLKKLWEKVNKDYGDQPPLHQAEEVFAFVAEEERSPVQQQWDKSYAKLQQSLRQKGFSDRPVTLAELRVTARQVATEIQQGCRHQQTFPRTDQDQFRRTTQQKEPRQHFQKKPVQYQDTKRKQKLLDQVRERRLHSKARSHSIER